MGSRLGERNSFELTHGFFPCFIVLPPRAAIGGADRALHVQGNGRTLHVPPDDHGCREDHRRGTDFRTAAC